MAGSESDSTTNSQQEVTRLVHSASRDGEADTHAGDRDARRFAVGMPLDVTTDPPVPACSWPVTMHNISGGGFAFWSKRQARIGAKIWVREFSADNSQPWVAAEVSHCTKGIRGFLVGASFSLPAVAQ